MIPTSPEHEPSNIFPLPFPDLNINSLEGEQTIIRVYPVRRN